MENAQVLPKELRLSAPPTMPQARSYLFKQQASLSSYKDGETIQINIPRLQRSYLTKESYLKFGVKIPFTTSATITAVTGTSTTTFKYNEYPVFDTPGVLGLIKKIEVYDYLGSTLLESTNGHDALSALLLDLGVSNEQFGTHHNIVNGTQQGPIILDADVTNANTVIHKTLAPTHGHQFADYDLYHTATYASGDTVSATPVTKSLTAYKEFSFPLFSFLGSLSQKDAPLHNGFTISITLNSFNRAIGFMDHSDGSEPTGELDFTDMTINDVYMCCQILELGPVAESMLLSSTQGQPLVIPSKAYRNFIGNLTTKSTSAKIDLNLNVASLTNILFIQRNYATLHTNPQYKRCLGNRIRNYLYSWYFQYGSSVLPQTSGISCRGRLGDDNDKNNTASTEAYTELMKSRHNWSSASANSVINSKNFNIDSDTDDFTGDELDDLLWAGTTRDRPTFACGLDLELVAGRSNDIICGMNTNGMNTAIFLNYDSTAATASGDLYTLDAQIDVWCEYDSFINVSPGLATTVSF